MSIASEITRIQGNIADAYTQANAKGATMPVTQNSDNLASTIATISTGAPGLYREFQLDNTGKLIPNTTTTHIMDFTGMTDVSDYTLYQAYLNNTAISGAVDMGDLTAISGANACYEMFRGCTGITSADLSSLTTISGSYACQYMFRGCTGITSANLSSLTTISASGACASMFYGCTNLTSLSFPAITTTSFGTRTNQFNGMCSGIPNITLHFPSNVQSVVEGLSGYSATAPFGAVSGSVLFDLPATS